VVCLFYRDAVQDSDRSSVSLCVIWTGVRALCVVSLCHGMTMARLLCAFCASCGRVGIVFAEGPDLFGSGHCGSGRLWAVWACIARRM
jgi:hypothetical protein